MRIVRASVAPKGLQGRLDVGNVTSYVVTALTTGQVYYFVVQAYNSAGTSPFSAEVSGPR